MLRGINEKTGSTYLEVPGILNIKVTANYSVIEMGIIQHTIK